MRNGLSCIAEKPLSWCRKVYIVMSRSLFGDAGRLFGDVTRLELYCNTVFIAFLNSGDNGA